MRNTLRAALRQKVPHPLFRHNPHHAPGFKIRKKT